MLLSRLLEAELSKRVWRVPKGLLNDLPSGIVPFSNNQKTLVGNLLVDRSLASPIQVINYEQSDIDKNYIQNCINEAFKYRLDLHKKNQLDLSGNAAFRLFNESGDGIPGLAIDIYGKYAMLHVYSKYWKRHLNFIAHYLTKNEYRPVTGVYLVDHIRPDLTTENQNEARISQAKEDLKQENPNVFESKKSSASVSERVDNYIDKKNRSRNAFSNSEKNEAGERGICIAGDRAPNHHTIVIENGISYHVTLSQGSSCGLYIDQRENRRKLLDLLMQSPAEKRSLLNTFCFTCSFSLLPAANGISTANIDLSRTSIDWGKDNFMENGFDLNKHEFFSKDVFLGLPKMGIIRREFQAVLLDPPTLARVRRRDGSKFTFSAKDNYDDLIKVSAPLVQPGGYLVAFINNPIVVDRMKWRSDVMKAIDELVPAKQKELEEDMFLNRRKSLRKRNIRKKERQRMLQKMDFSVPLSEAQKRWQFDLVEEWGPGLDFRIREGDDSAKRIYGIVMKRTWPGEPKK